MKNHYKNSDGKGSSNSINIFPNLVNENQSMKIAFPNYCATKIRNLLKRI